jgi:hypothetical protein
VFGMGTVGPSQYGHRKLETALDLRYGWYANWKYMQIEQILLQLQRNTGHFAKHAVLEAVAHRDQITPALLDVLQDAADKPESYIVDRDSMILIYAMYLLAQFRETRAYPLLVRIFSLPGEMSFDLVGDTVTEGLDKILASVSGGDARGMAALIESEQVNPYVRAAALHGLVTLVAAGMRSREETVDYFKSLFQQLDRTPGDTWAWLASACADLWPDETMEDLKLAWSDGLIDSEIIHWEDIEDDHKRGREECLRRLRRKRRLITDVVKEIAWWACFKNDNVPEFHKGAIAESRTPDQFSIHRTTPKVGRNDPCPCLSGRKFKKCCGS